MLHHHKAEVFQFIEERTESSESGESSEEGRKSGSPSKRPVVPQFPSSG